MYRAHTIGCQTAGSNTIHLDVRGLPISTHNAKAAAAFDHLVTGYLTYRADTPVRLDAVLEADPDFALAHCIKGYFAMLAFKQAVVPVAVQSARTADTSIFASSTRTPTPCWGQPSRLRARPASSART